jgi:hypothetical protein
MEDYAMRTFAFVGAMIMTLSSAWSASATEEEIADVDSASHATKRCARQFEEAQRADMESFRDFDEVTFREGHHPDAVTIFASGAVRSGIDAIMAALASHFRDREAIWAWTEVYRVVDGCKSAFILYNATYDIPSVGFHQRTLTGVTYTYQHNKWLSIADQGTYLEAPAQ